MNDAGALVIAVIPARGGSKGIPGKNLVELAGRPLIAWSIRQALAAASVDRVLVSTDDLEIAEQARSWGAEVPFMRPSALAADDTPDLPVFRHVIEELARVEGSEPDVVVHLRPTSPVRPAGLIDSAVELLLSDPTLDSVRSVTPAAKTPYKMWRLDRSRLEPLLGSWDEELFNQPRQSLPEVWHQDGVIDVVRTRVLRAGSMCGRSMAPVFTPSGCSVDIDLPADLAEAERRMELFDLP